MSEAIETKAVFVLMKAAFNSNIQTHDAKCATSPSLKEKRSIDKKLPMGKILF